MKPQPSSYRVVCRIPGRNGKEETLRTIGRAYRNADGCINVFLDALPSNSRLELHPPEEP